MNIGFPPASKPHHRQVGILTLSQVAFSKSDIRKHDTDSQPATSIGEVYNSLLQEMTTLRGPESDLDWARILAVDMWVTRFRPDAISREAGLRYRWVLGNGGGRDEWVLVGFLDDADAEDEVEGSWAGPGFEWNVR
ncbi:hypothetical protein ABOM_004279 [Aspergillus bombycis]|uniref:Uncharacterized protein n=1 Tax=Aspergillus bombycis TaxID=109264 RepID=A0A1F8A8S1_9EURO|nr:hypothetical protein ABOM_004279 [Aspergillus bombycis]OGM47698.1 hypothetical protein ABOM_004279 [Aspergillus bombycis]